MSPQRVLIVEDEDNARTALAEHIASWGYETESARDGVEGLEKADQFSPSIVVTDLKMPRMDGMEMLERLDPKSKGIEVIVVTAQGPKESAFQAGCCTPSR